MTRRTDSYPLDASPTIEPGRHCDDCCCAESWRALGVSEYDGKSIVEHITELRARVEPGRCGECAHFDAPFCLHADLMLYPDASEAGYCFVVPDADFGCTLFTPREGKEASDD